MVRRAQRHGRLLPDETWTEAGVALHPSTAPAALAARHAAEVAEYLRDHPAATVDEVGAALTLPRWNVERALAAIQSKGAA